MTIDNEKEGNCSKIKIISMVIVLQIMFMKLKLPN